MSSAPMVRPRRWRRAKESRGERGGPWRGILAASAIGLCRYARQLASRATAMASLQSARALETLRTYHRFDTQLDSARIHIMFKCCRIRAPLLGVVHQAD